MATRTEVDRKTSRAYRRVEPVLRPLLELFATVDDVMSEHDAFEDGNIHKSLGRIYREWLDTREALDPDFDRARYRHEMKSRKTKKTPLGRPVKGSPSSSTARKSISGTSPKKTGSGERRTAKGSATAARSGGSASGSRSTTEKSSACGEESPRRKGNVSESGSRRKGTPASRKTKG